MDEKMYIHHIKFPDRIRARLGTRVRRILLFGSQARGDAHEDSDADYLVVLSSALPDVNDILDDEAGRMLVEEGRVISAFAVTEADFERFVYNPLFMNIRREGIAL
jgi:predicted nucleotidyltransferase